MSLLAHSAIALPLAAPSAVVVAVAVGMATGVRPPLWEWPTVDLTLWAIRPVPFFSSWFLFTLFASIGNSSKEVFRRTCCIYAFAAFILTLATIVWGTSVANKSGWEGMGAGLLIGTTVLFGISTGGIALFLGFGNLRSRIPDFDNPYGRRIPPG